MQKLSSTKLIPVRTTVIDVHLTLKVNVCGILLKDFDDCLLLASLTTF